MDQLRINRGGKAIADGRSLMEEPSRIPELASDAIHVWSVRVSGVLGQLDALHALLSAEEQGRAARFRRETDRQSSIAARGALRILLSGYTGIPAAKLAFQYSENGKPSLVPPVPSAERGRGGGCDSISFNLSHSGDWVVLAFGHGCNLGVDIEKIRPKMDVLPIASRYFTPGETARIEASADPREAFFQHWVRKEAYVKACGSALFRELGTFAVPMSGTWNGWWFQGLEIDPRYAAAAVADKAPENVLSFGFV